MVAKQDVEEEETETEETGKGETEETGGICALGVFAVRDIRRGEVIRVTGSLRAEKKIRKEVLEKEKRHQSLAYLSYMGSVPKKGGGRKRKKIEKFGRLMGGASFINSGHEECCNVYPVSTKGEYGIFKDSSKLVGFQLSNSKQWGLWMAKRPILNGGQLAFYYGITFSIVRGEYTCVVCGDNF